MGRGHSLQVFRVHVEATAALYPLVLPGSKLHEVGHLVPRPPSVVAAQEPRVGVPLCGLVRLRLEQVAGGGAEERGAEVRGLGTALWEGGGGGENRISKQDSTALENEARALSWSTVVGMAREKNGCRMCPVQNHMFRTLL